MIRHLFVPGLLGPVPGITRAERPPVRCLETLLARADRAPEPHGHARALFALFGVESASDRDLPSAAVCALADTGEAPAGYVLHADPLRLHPDRDQLLAFDLTADPLQADEIGELVQAFNDHFCDDGLNLYASTEGRMYLGCACPPSLRTHPLSAVSGRAVDGLLPDGEDRRRWRGLLNETQMLCHGLPLNQLREQGGRPTLGGLWFSGGGELPRRGQGRIARIVGDDVLARGLMALQGTAGDDELIVESALQVAAQRGDVAAWLQQLLRIEDRVATLVEDGVPLHLHSGRGLVYRWSARAARRWWRRRRPLADYMDVGRAGAASDSHADIRL